MADGLKIGEAPNRNRLTQLHKRREHADAAKRDLDEQLAEKRRLQQEEKIREKQEILDQYKRYGAGDEDLSQLIYNQERAIQKEREELAPSEFNRRGNGGDRGPLFNNDQGGAVKAPHLFENKANPMFGGGYGGGGAPLAGETERDRRLRLRQEERQRAAGGGGIAAGFDGPGIRRQPQVPANLPGASGAGRVDTEQRGPPGGGANVSKRDQVYEEKRRRFLERQQGGGAAGRQPEPYAPAPAPRGPPPMNFENPASDRSMSYGDAQSAPNTDRRHYNEPPEKDVGPRQSKIDAQQQYARELAEQVENKQRQQQRQPRAAQAPPQSDGGGLLGIGSDANNSKAAQREEYARQLREQIQAKEDQKRMNKFGGGDGLPQVGGFANQGGHQNRGGYQQAAPPPPQGGGVFGQGPDPRDAAKAKKEQYRRELEEQMLAKQEKERFDKMRANQQERERNWGGGAIHQQQQQQQQPPPQQYQQPPPQQYQQPPPQQYNQPIPQQQQYNQPPPPSGIGNMHTGPDPSARAARETKQSAYQRELDEQIRLKKEMKQREKMQDQQQQQIYDPFGRGGAGAPNRGADGSAITSYQNPSKMHQRDPAFAAAQPHEPYSYDAGPQQPRYEPQPQYNPQGGPPPDMYGGQHPQQQFMQQPPQQQMPPQMQGGPQSPTGFMGAVSTMHGVDMDKERAKAAKRAELAQALEQQIQDKKRRERAAKEEEARHEMIKMKEAEEYNPWGRGGAGAPVRNNRGEIITDLRQVNKNPDIVERPALSSPVKGLGGPRDFPPEQGRDLPNRRDPYAAGGPPGPPGYDAPPEPQAAPGGGGQRNFAYKGGLFEQDPETVRRKANEAQGYQDELQRQIREKEEMKRKQKEKEEEEDRRAEERFKAQMERIADEERREKEKEAAKNQPAKEGTGLYNDAGHHVVSKKYKRHLANANKEDNDGPPFDNAYLFEKEKKDGPFGEFPKEDNLPAKRGSQVRRTPPQSPPARPNPGPVGPPPMMMEQAPPPPMPAPADNSNLSKLRDELLKEQQDLKEAVRQQNEALMQLRDQADMSKAERQRAEKAEQELQRMRESLERREEEERERARDLQKYRSKTPIDFDEGAPRGGQRKAVSAGRRQENWDYANPSAPVPDKSPLRTSKKGRGGRIQAPYQPEEHLERSGELPHFAESLRDSTGVDQSLVSESKLVYPGEESGMTQTMKSMKMGNTRSSRQKGYDLNPPSPGSTTTRSVSSVSSFSTGIDTIDRRNRNRLKGLMEYDQKRKHANVDQLDELLNDFLDRKNEPGRPGSADTNTTFGNTLNTTMGTTRSSGFRPDQSLQAETRWIQKADDGAYRTSYE